MRDKPHAQFRFQAFGRNQIERDLATVLVVEDESERATVLTALLQARIRKASDPYEGVIGRWPAH